METWKDRCINRQWEKKLKERVDREDLIMWAKGFDSKVGYLEDDINETRTVNVRRCGGEVKTMEKGKPNLTVEELRRNKKILEENIKILVYAFEKETGVEVTHILRNWSTNEIEVGIKI